MIYGSQNNVNYPPEISVVSRVGVRACFGNHCRTRLLFAWDLQSWGPDFTLQLVAAVQSPLLWWAACHVMMTWHVPQLGASLRGVSKP